MATRGVGLISRLRFPIFNSLCTIGSETSRSCFGGAGFLLRFLRTVVHFHEYSVDFGTALSCLCEKREFHLVEIVNVLWQCRTKLQTIGGSNRSARAVGA